MEYVGDTIMKSRSGWIKEMNVMFKTITAHFGIFPRIHSLISC